ncbi:MAG: hypothetical protein Q9212_003951 [Teloschistes hypoglaucus]
MSENEDRLFVALYAREDLEPGADSYHWALIVGPELEPIPNEQQPKKQKSMRFHTTNRGRADWIFEDQNIDELGPALLIAKVVVAKVINIDRLQSVLRGVPVVQDDPSFNCSVWVHRALDAVQADAEVVSASQLDWPTVRDAANGYVQGKKRKYRYAGRGRPGQCGLRQSPTYDLLEGREIVA